MPRVITDTREKVVQMHLSGMTNGQIRLATGLSRGTIGGHIHRWRRDGSKAVQRDPTKTFSPDTLRKSNPSYDKERDTEARHRENDRRFVRALALAIQAGENLPAGSPRPLRLIG
jgi:hypothetical protein